LLWSHIAELASRTPCDAFLLSGTAPLPQAVFTTMLDTGYQMLEFFGSSEMGVMCCRTQPHNAFSLLPQFTRLTGEKAHCIQRTLPDGTTQDFPLQDTIEWLDERHLEPRGRKDYAVQVGGVNVSPAHVIKVLMTHPHIAACAVRLMRPEEGHRLKAFIVPQKNCDSEEIRKTLRAFVKQNLTEEEQPARFDFGEVLPLNLMGKSTDW
jgi:long-chain acyl-CoA synthetase